MARATTHRGDILYAMRWLVRGILFLLPLTTYAFVSPRHCRLHTPCTTPQLPPRENYSPFVSFIERKQTNLFISPQKGIEFSSLLYDSTSTAFDAWEWTANLGAPAALVGIAVLETMVLTRETFVAQKGDRQWIRVFKRLCRFMLFSSFALEIVSIFASTVTGTMLLGHGECVAKKAVGYTSPLGLLHHHHEFEYLTIQITFLQGLYNWLVAVAMELLIPREEEKKSARRMNQALASCTMSVVFWITAFYNNHLNFYSDYASMLKRYVVLLFKYYFSPIKTFRPMSLLYIPSFLMTGALIWRAFQTPSDESAEVEEEG